MNALTSGGVRTHNHAVKSRALCQIGATEVTKVFIPKGRPGNSSFLGCYGLCPEGIDPPRVIDKITMLPLHQGHRTW